MIKAAQAPEWTPLEGRDLLIAVRRIVGNNPERYNQESWISNVFRSAYVQRPLPTLLVDMARQFAYLPVPVTPADATRPVCGTTGCVAGWGAILGAPDGTQVNNGSVFLPDGTDSSIWDYARERFGLDTMQASWLFEGNRTRDEVLEALDALIENPRAYIGDEEDED